LSFLFRAAPSSRSLSVRRLPHVSQNQNFIIR
jgi:hypothetical protein